MDKQNENVSFEDMKEGSFLSFEGTCTLRKYWFHFLISILIVFADYGYSYLYKYTSYILDLAEIIIYLIVLVVWNIHLMCLAVQRMRSVGENPWKILIPLYGPITVRFIPSKKNQTDNKYINYQIPGKKWLRIILLIFAISSSGALNYKDSIQTALSGISMENSGRVVFSSDDINCNKYYTNEGVNYYFNIYRYDGYVINTVVFSKAKTLRYLEKQYKEIKKTSSENYLEEFCDMINELYYDNPSIEFYDEEGKSIIYLEPDEYLDRTDGLIEEYNPLIIRFWYEDFDYVFVEDLISSTSKVLHEAKIQDINKRL